MNDRGRFARWMARPVVSPAVLLWAVSVSVLWASYGPRVGFGAVIGGGGAVLTTTGADR